MIYKGEKKRSEFKDWKRLRKERQERANTLK